MRIQGNHVTVFATSAVAVVAHLDAEPLNLVSRRGMSIVVGVDETRSYEVSLVAIEGVGQILILDCNLSVNVTRHSLRSLNFGSAEHDLVDIDSIDKSSAHDDGNQKDGKLHGRD